MHNLKLVKSSEVKDWKKFLLFNVQPGDYIFSPDIAKDMFSEITRQTQILDTLYLAVKRDPFNLALFWRHVDFFASMKGWFSETGLRATFKKDLFLRLWINTGLYIGPDRAWELYITHLAHCLGEACDIRARMEHVEAQREGSRLGSICADIFSVNAFMLAPPAVLVALE